MMKTTKKLKSQPPTVEFAKNDLSKPALPKTEPAKPAPATPVTAKPVAAAPVVVKPPTPVAKPAPTEPVNNKPAPKNVVFLELVKPEAKSVAVAGSFNEWKPDATPLRRLGNGRWVGDLTVKPGRHEYLFVVDGQWLPDPNAKENVANPFGGKNSVLIVSE